MPKGEGSACSTPLSLATSPHFIFILLRSHSFILDAKVIGETFEFTIKPKEIHLYSIQKELVYGEKLNYGSSSLINGDYFNVYDPNNPDDGGYTQKQVDLFKEIYSIPDFSSYSIDCLFEKPISDLDKSNMHWAFNEEKEKI